VVAAALVVLGGCGGSGNSSHRSSTATEERKTAIAVLRALKSAGLPIDGFINYTAVTDDNHLLGRPGQYVHKVNFHDTRLEKANEFDIDGGGSIETFKSEGDAKNRYDYVHAISSGSAIFAEYEYLEGTILLRLSHYMTPKQAAVYKQALLSGG
jgi:hypothetical protein